MAGMIYCNLLGALRELTQVSGDLALVNVPEPLISPVTEEGVPIRKLFIGNLAERTTNKDLQKLFSEYGKVDSCYIKRNQGKSNFAFVTFNAVEGGIKARKAAQRMELQLHCRILRVSSADSWHQPDSIENQKRFSSLKEKQNKNEEQVSVQQIPQDDSPIQVLNDDCLIEIFLYLPIADRIRMERVCKRWQALSQESWRSVKRLDLVRGNWGLSPKIRLQNIDTSTLRKVLIKCGQFLTHLDLSKYPHLLGSSTLTIVGKFCPNLQCINVKALELSPSGIASLMTNCQNITKFVMKSLTGPCENYLSQLFMVNKKLVKVEIEDEHVIGKCLGQLPTDTVEEIHLILCTSVLSTYFDAALQKFPSLKKLTLNTCVCLTDSSLKTIGKIETLTHLELSGNYPTFSASSMNHLTNLSNLEHLNLCHNIVVTDEFLINLSGSCKKLNHLDITGCEAITNKAIGSLSSLPRLESLVISWLTQVTDQPLGNLQSLKILTCWGCQLIQDAGVVKLIKMAPNLVSLDLSRCSISNSTIEAAISTTKHRKTHTMLKIIVGKTKVELSQISGVSPFLQIVNIDLSMPRGMITTDAREIL
ncbi:putative RNA-binding protein EEED8.10 [Diachasma alloeum]|uniref:putative RNA-binding protein EEED8.10 n=1 Tax=Diachasma alloeum TaxID=454923 RepID=UPI0007381148|nr:putative RNA-binding protein EEED8.10 [Diachasma alloeum]